MDALFGNMVDGPGPLEILTQGAMGPLLAGVWGALWGSFFNVLIVRLPAGESVVRPASHCRSCRQPLRWYDNIPLLSYLLLCGRCRRCRARVSPRYVMVELLVCLLALALHQVYIVGGQGPLEARIGQFAIVSIFAGVLVAIALIDIDTMLIPNAITYPGIPLAVLLSLFMDRLHLWDGLVGAMAGYLVIRLFADGYKLVTGRQGMGYGDAKLLAMIGGLLGWQVLLPTLFLASLQGSVIGITLIVIARRRNIRLGDVGPSASASSPDGEDTGAEDPEDEVREDPPPLRYVKMPFGPFLSLAALEMLLLADPIMSFFPYLR